MNTTPPLTLAELAELEAQSERFTSLRLRSVIPAATVPEWDRLEYQLAAAVPRLLRDLAALRERYRWRTVSADGLPEVGKRELVRREGHPATLTYVNERGCWHDDRSLGFVIEDPDRWLPVPGENE